MSLAEPVTTGQARRPGVLAGGLDATALEAAYASDHWDCAVLGVPAPRGRGTVNFAGICQPWLKEAVKSWCRWRLGNGGASGTVSASVLALGRASDSPPVPSHSRDPPQNQRCCANCIIRHGPRSRSYKGFGVSCCDKS